jgi:hypothetical protein
MRREGTSVRYVQSVLVPEEESVFCLFEGPSAEAVATLNRRAGVPVERVSEACHVTEAEVKSGRLPGAGPGVRKGRVGTRRAHGTESQT